MEARFDRDAAGRTVIDTAHEAVHGGRSFHGFRYTSLDAGQLLGVILDLTAATKEAHLTYEVASGGDGLIELFEATTRGNGNAIAVFNRHRKKATSPTATPNTTLLFQANLGVGADGVGLEARFLPGGALLITQGGRAESRAEWVLDPGTKYLLKFSNLAGNTQQVSMGIDWYEVD